MTKQEGVTIDLTDAEIEKFKRMNERATKAFDEMSKTRGTAGRFAPGLLTM